MTSITFLRRVFELRAGAHEVEVEALEQAGLRPPPGERGSFAAAHRCGPWNKSAFM